MSRWKGLFFFFIKKKFNFINDKRFFLSETKEKMYMDFFNFY